MVKNEDHLLLYDPLRLRILVRLYKDRVQSFTTLKIALGVTDGRLASHLRKMEGAGWLQIEKRFIDRRPNTSYSLTDGGKKALQSFHQEILELLSDVA